MRVTWLGHSSVVLDLDGVRILTDPLLRPHAGLLRRLAPRPDPASWSRSDVVLLSHLHHDHAELRSLRMLPGATLMSDPANVAWLRRRRLPDTVPLGDSWTAAGNMTATIQVRQVPADHRQRPMPHRPNAANGQLVRGASGTAWIAGDTGLFPAMAAIPAMAGGTIDVALVPVWGWGPRLSAGHLTPETAAQAVALSGARFAIPVHWGTLHPPFVTHFARSWLELPGRRFAEAVAEQAPGCTAVVLAPGQSWVAPA
ncbi:MBL fold metallo-hydrolase [Arthrobacter sp. YAF17]|uniref:MBL fold metallo-hydrolase n=1 Tax=Arthrobacter sp. YAF17 TaxID=3233077 RepID=UPI003F8FFC58